MSIKDFELFHGAVLTKLVRSDRPITLRMIETNPKEAWSAYTVNDEVTLYIKYSTTPSSRKREENALVWSFSFSVQHLKQLQNLSENREVYIALVCGQRNLSENALHICFIEPNELSECMDVNSMEPQTIQVKYLPAGRLRVWGGVNTAKNPKLIASSKIEKWVVPGN